MINDIQSVMWKESKSLFRRRASRSNLLRIILAPGLLAFVFPITWGPDWVTDFPALIIAFIAPAVLVGVLIPDSFAGERERHTLGTLLATRLPDQAILLGKMLPPVLVGWGSGLLFTLLSLVIVNIANGDGSLLLYTPTITFGILSLSFLSSTVMAAGGVLTSLRSETVQDAAQKLMTFVLVPAVLAQVLPLLFSEQVGALIGGVDGQQVLVIMVVFLALIDAALWVLAFVSFQRSKMYLD
jgi:ABC-2 type transport system permease protein